MITLIHTTENDYLPKRTVTLTTESEVLESVLTDMEAFLRCVFVIDANEHLVFDSDTKEGGESVYR